MIHPLLFSAGFRSNEHSKLVQKRASHESLWPRLEETADTYVERGSQSLTAHSLKAYNLEVEKGANHSDTQKAKRRAGRWRKILELIDLE
jgi:hypothetical protein